jgi:hypothetical protein
MTAGWIAECLQMGIMGHVNHRLHRKKLVKEIVQDENMQISTTDPFTLNRNGMAGCV